MSEKLTFRVRLKRSDGAEYTTTMEGMKQHLGLDAREKIQDNRFNVLWKRTEDLEEELEDLYLPEMLKTIEGFVRDAPDCKTREISTDLWREVAYTRARRGAFNTAFELLQARGQIVPTSHGPGKNRTWRVKEPGHK